ncbi:Peroxisomal membrane protein PMP27, partial [Spiromyces aspiralis]
GLYQLIPLHFKESLVYRAHSALGRERDAASAHSETEKSMVSRQLCAVKRQLVQDTLDMTIPLSALGLVNFNEGVVALAGTITSFMGGQAHFYKLFI